MKTREKVMAKKVNRKNTFVVRLPESYRELLDKLIAKSVRDYTKEVQLALQDWARKHGEVPPAIGG